MIDAKIDVHNTANSPREGRVGCEVYKERNICIWQFMVVQFDPGLRCPFTEQLFAVNSTVIALTIRIFRHPDS